MQKTVSLRKLRAIDVEAFKQDTVVCSVLQTTHGDVDSLVSGFNEGLTSLKPSPNIQIVHGTLMSYMRLNISDGSWNDDGRRIAWLLTTRYVETNVLW